MYLPTHRSVVQDRLDVGEYVPLVFDDALRCQARLHEDLNIAKFYGVSKYASLSFLTQRENWCEVVDWTRALTVEVKVPLLLNRLKHRLHLGHLRRELLNVRVARC
jgi:hypothetical protein